MPARSKSAPSVLSPRIKSGAQAVRHSLSLRAAPLHSAAHAVEADDPARNRCGCFLPDL